MLQKGFVGSLVLTAQAAAHPHFRLKGLTGHPRKRVILELHRAFGTGLLGGPEGRPQHGRAFGSRIWRCPCLRPRSPSFTSVPSVKSADRGSPSAGKEAGHVLALRKAPSAGKEAGQRVGIEIRDMDLESSRLLCEFSGCAALWP